MKAFHAYDIRGVYNKDFDKQDVYKTGYFLPELLKASKILVGQDVRKSSPEVFEYLSQGINDAGADVYNLGLSTTPMVYWATAKFGFDGSVMITASHNSKEYNGLKVSKKDALPVGYDNGLIKIEENIENNSPVVPVVKRGKIINYDITSDYLAFQKKYLKSLDCLKIAVDCSNGMAGLFIRKLLGNDAIYLNEVPDGNFPNHDPNPLVLKNVKQLQETVDNEGCDIGVIFDGDADRVMFVDEKGSFVPPDLIIALLGHYFLHGPENNKRVLQDIRSSKSVGEYISRFGGNIHTWKVGRAFAAIKLREIEGIYGGELAGHYYFKDFYYSDSGIMACLIVLGILSDFKRENKTFSSLIDDIRNYENSGEINFRINQKASAMEKVRDYFMKSETPRAFYNFDGYRIEFENWWFNIRPSNTEPYLRLLVEANTPQRLEEKIKKIKSIISNFV